MIAVTIPKLQAALHNKQALQQRISWVCRICACMLYVWCMIVLYLHVRCAFITCMLHVCIYFACMLHCQCMCADILCNTVCISCMLIRGLAAGKWLHAQWRTQQLECNCFEWAFQCGLGLILPHCNTRQHCSSQGTLYSHDHVMQVRSIKVPVTRSCPITFMSRAASKADHLHKLKGW